MKKNNIISLEEWKKRNKIYAPKKQAINTNIDKEFKVIQLFPFGNDEETYSEEDENLLSGMIIW